MNKQTTSQFFPHYRFWETDLRTVRKTNRSTMRQRRGGGGPGAGGTVAFRDKLLSGYQGLEEHRSPEMDSVLEQALKEAEDDVTFKKVKRMSYSSNAAGELTQRLAKLAGLNKQATDLGGLGTSAGSHGGSRMNSIRGSSRKVDLKALDKLVTNLLEQQASAPQHSTAGSELGSSTIYASTPAKNRKASVKLNRWRPTSRSAHSFNITEGTNNFNTDHETSNGSGSGSGGGGGGGGSSGGDMQPMPTIMESSTTPSTGKNNNERPSRGSLTRSQRSSWSSSLDRTPGAVRNVLRNISAATVQTGTGGGSEENLNLTKNFVP
uniref:Uncharacterized protein n=1 Tax=Stomoxys calcitrans TaxID=35570 RepID=A0A1I8PJ43_STOCA